MRRGHLIRYLHFYLITIKKKITIGGRRSHDRLVVGFTTTCVISAYHH